MSEVLFLSRRMYSEIQRTRAGQSAKHKSRRDQRFAPLQIVASMGPGTIQILSQPLKTKVIMEFCKHTPSRKHTNTNNQISAPETATHSCVSIKHLAPRMAAKYTHVLPI